MLNAHFMVRTDDRPLQEAPYALNPIGVNVANNPFFGRVINPLVLSVGIFDSPIRRHFIGVDRFRVGCCVVMDKLMKHGLSSVRDNLQANHSVALDCSDASERCQKRSAKASEEVAEINYHATKLAQWQTCVK